MMYRPGMGVDPWYENFKFFLTYWLLSSNNRERMGEADQLPPPPPNGPQGPPPFMSPHHKPSLHAGQGHQNQSSKSPNSAPPSGNAGQHQINWDAIEKNQSSGNSPRHGQGLSLSDNYGDIALKQHLQQQQQQNGPNSGGLGNHLSPHHMNHQTNPVGLQPEHMLTDKDRRHVCPHCYKGFRSRQQLNQHNLVHSGVRKYHCLYCERSFKQLSHLQQHHRIHTGEKPYRCPIDGCDKAFAQMSNLQHHMRQHDKTTFGQKHCMCPFCDRGYASEKSLKSHLSKMHPDSKMLSLGSPRSNLSLMEGQGRSMLGSPQPGVTISHRHSLPTMYPSMKSPLTPPGGPLELTVNAHQRTGMGNDGRKFSLDSSKIALNNDMPPEAKYFQRTGSLTDRLPDRDQSKIDNILDQRFGIQNHIRDVNRFTGRSFEPFSPSRFHDSVRSFDFKDLESKLFDPSGDKFQRMAENFNEFRSRFQDQMISMNRRDGIRGNGMSSFENRNMLHEMTERNAYFNSRGDMGFNNRDRYQNNRSFSSMSGNDMDNFNSSRHDELRVHSRNDINMNSPNGTEYNRPRDGAADDIAMQMDNRGDVRGNGMRVEQTMSNMRLNPENGDVIMNRCGSAASGMQMSQGSDMRVNRRNGLLGNPDNEMTNLNQQRNGMDMNIGNGRLMMSPPIRNEVMNGRNSLISHRDEMMNGGNENGLNGRRTDMDMMERNNVSSENEHDGGMHQESDKARRQELDMLGGGTDLRTNRNNDISVNAQNDLQLRQSNEMGIDDNMNITDVTNNGNDLRVHSRGNVQMNMCNDIQMRRPDSAYSDKPDLRLQNQTSMMMNRNDGNLGSVHDDLNMNRSTNIHQISNQHGAPKQNGHDEMIQDNGMDFVDGNENKNSPTSNPMSDPNLIRQRKRKPANPQHVFMPSIDHYTSFAADEVEDCSGLMLDVENGGNFDRKMAQLNMRN